MKENITELDVVRAVLMICIVLYHSSVFWCGNWFQIPTEQSSSYLSIFAQWLNSFHVYGFVFLSGYLFYYLKKEKGKYNDFLQFVKIKVSRLLLPYLAISVLWNIPFSYYFGINKSNLMSNYFLGIKPGQLWFLLMLFLVFIIFYLLEKQKFFYKQNKLSFISLFCVMLCYVMGIVGNKIIPNCFQIWTALTFIFFFYLGFATREGVLFRFLKNDNFHLFFYAVLQIILFALTNILEFHSYLIQKTLMILLNFFCHALGAFVSFSILMRIGKYITNSKIISIMSNMSFGVYLFHQQIIFLCLYIMVNKFTPTITSTLSFIISYTVSFVIAFLLSKFKYTRLIIGMK